ncbi:WG repeat-containing protein [Flavobacteriaceae sp. LMIT009]
MKKLVALFALVLLIPLNGISQNLDKIDYISPFNDGLASVKKGNEWGFINTNGDLVIAFREDLVLSKVGALSYPIFSNERCLITEELNGISYFGYINTTGKTIIEPQFLNATNFNESKAIALELVKKNLGTNNLLDKPVVSYDYFEVVIDVNGNILHYLMTEPIHITLSKKFIRHPPNITTRLLSNGAYAILGKNKKWEIRKFKLTQ